MPGRQALLPTAVTDNNDLAGLREMVRSNTQSHWQGIKMKDSRPLPPCAIGRKVPSRASVFFLVPRLSLLAIHTSASTRLAKRYSIAYVRACNEILL